MKVLFEKSQIENRIKEIGVQILNRHKEENTPIVLVGVLNGGFMFYSKLVDQLAMLDPQCDFIRVKSYKGREHEVPEIIIPSSLNIKNKFVYILILVSNKFIFWAICAKKKFIFLYIQIEFCRIGSIRNLKLFCCLKK
jgi:hypoxanthine-guanine phosphoribosyltransferase